MQAVNKYYSSEHNGPNRGWLVSPGDTYANESVLFHPEKVPTNIKQPVGKPMIITESSWVSPNAYQAEGPLLIAAQQSLNGVDAYYWFATNDIAWDENPKNPWYAGGTGLWKWNVNSPTQMGGFPAAALLWRRGDLQAGSTVVHEERSLDNLWERTSPVIAEGSGFDPNRDSGNLPPGSGVSSGVDPKAFVAGRVEVKYDGNPANTTTNLDGLIDENAKTIRSSTNQVVFDYGDGLFTVNSPRCQGAAGFLDDAGPINLDDLEIDSGNHYASIIVISLDEEDS